MRLSQWWRTRDQGDSLTVAARLADIVGIDYYSRHALTSLGPRTLYLAGADLPWQAGLRERRFGSIRTQGKRLMVAEGQAEPWETMTTPPNPKLRTMYSCPPDHLVSNYNAAIGWSRRDDPIYAYLFWGAEYWLLRDRPATQATSRPSLEYWTKRDPIAQARRRPTRSGRRPWRRLTRLEAGRSPGPITLLGEREKTGTCLPKENGGRHRQSASEPLRRARGKNQTRVGGAVIACAL